MSRKKGFRTVVATVIVTLVILAALSYATLKYIAPAYQLNQNKIYQVAVKVFPLVLGITLIAIASVLASGNDEEDEDDKLPPNSYDASLFDEPKDDPTAKEGDAESAQGSEPAEAGKQEDTPFVSVFETGSDEGAPQDVETTEKASEDTPAEEPEETAESKTEETETETKAEEEEVEEQPKEDLNKPLIDAIKALSDKIDDFAAAVVYGTEDSEEDEDDEEYYDGEEEEDPIYEGLDRIEAQLEKLTQTISQMAENLNGNLVVAPQSAAPEAQVEAIQPQEVEEKQEETPAAPATPSEPVQPIVVSNDNTGDMLYRNYEGSDAKKKAMAEYDSAKEFGYDLTLALIDLSLSQVALALGEVGDFVDMEGKTLAIIPFANEEESKAELDKLEASYKSNTYAAGNDMDFDELANGIVE